MSNLAVIPFPSVQDASSQHSGALRDAADAVLASCESIHTRRAYERHIAQFLTSATPLTRAGVNQYLNDRRVKDLVPPTSLNQMVAAIKKLSHEADMRGLIDRVEGYGISKIKNYMQKGQRVGNWLTIAGAQQLMTAPDRTRNVGKRDACLIALVLGCGLRREEASQITWDKYQPREGRMCLVNLKGKGNKVRTVPVPEWAKRDIDVWHDALVVKGQWQVDGKGVILRRMQKHYGRPDQLITPNRVGMSALTPNGIWYIVRSYAERIGVPNLRPHDLRRTLARLMRKAGAAWEQIQYVLGHSTVEMTQRYVGGDLELDEGKAAVDQIEWGELNG